MIEKYGRVVLMSEKEVNSSKALDLVAVFSCLVHELSGSCPPPANFALKALKALRPIPNPG